MISVFIKTFSKSSQLKIYASFLTNIAAGLLLTLPAIRDVWVLTGNIIFAIVCLLIAMRLEDKVEIYD